MGSNHLKQTIHDFGFHDVPAVHFPGEKSSLPPTLPFAKFRGGKNFAKLRGSFIFFSRQKWYFYLKSPFCLEPERLHNNNTCPQLVLFFFLRSPWTKMMRFDRSKSSKMKFRFICQHFLLCFPYFKAKILHFWAEVTKTLWLRAGPWVRYHDVSYGSPYRRRWWPRLKPSWLMVDPNTENTATQKRSWAELRILGSTLPETNSSPLKMVGFPIGISKLPWVNVQRLCFLFREGNCK